MQGIPHHLAKKLSAPACMHVSTPNYKYVNTCQVLCVRMALFVLAACNKRMFRSSYGGLPINRPAWGTHQQIEKLVAHRFVVKEMHFKSLVPPISFGNHGGPHSTCLDEALAPQSVAFLQGACMLLAHVAVNIVRHLQTTLAKPSLRGKE